MGKDAFKFFVLKRNPLSYENARGFKILKMEILGRCIIPGD
jgi:hypothetical protein